MVHGTLLCDGKSYGALGAMETGWHQVNGKWYYLYGNGVMASNATIYGYTINEKGIWIE